MPKRKINDKSVQPNTFLHPLCAIFVQSFNKKSEVGGELHKPLLIASCCRGPAAHGSLARFKVWEQASKEVRERTNEGNNNNE